MANSPTSRTLRALRIVMIDGHLSTPAEEVPDEGFKTAHPVKAEVKVNTPPIPKQEPVIDATARTAEQVIADGDQPKTDKEG